ncbi:MAG TPA: hypothetical protein VJ558_00260, partial [Bacillales bacterium]|nr:hypothetical protein [Bacillales bacterium]
FFIKAICFLLLMYVPKNTVEAVMEPIHSNFWSVRSHEAFINLMNDQNQLTYLKKGVHRPYERPKSIDTLEKGRSSTL